MTKENRYSRLKREDPIKFEALRKKQLISSKRWANENKERCGKNAIKKMRRRKSEAILYKGGYCSVCGVSYNNHNAVIFDFHHINPSSKDGALATFFRGKNKELTKKELDKCILVCSNCHRVIHGGDW